MDCKPTGGISIIIQKENTKRTVNVMKEITKYHIPIDFSQPRQN